MVHLKGFEPPTFRFVAEYSIQLSYRYVKVHVILYTKLAKFQEKINSRIVIVTMREVNLFHSWVVYEFAPVGTICLFHGNFRIHASSAGVLIAEITFGEIPSLRISQIHGFSVGHNAWSSERIRFGRDARIKHFENMKGNSNGKIAGFNYFCHGIIPPLNIMHYIVAHLEDIYNVLCTRLIIPRFT